MNRIFKCPVCGEKTITYTDKLKMNRRFKDVVECENCNSKLIVSRLDTVLTMIIGLLGFFIYMIDINNVLRLILIFIVIVCGIFGGVYIVPIVKYEEID